MSIEPQVNVVGHEDLPYFGIHLTCEVEAGQFKCRSLIDSGAQPSIMSVKTFGNVIKSLANSNEHIQILNFQARGNFGSEEASPSKFRL